MFKPRFRIRPVVLYPFVLLLIAFTLFQQGGRMVEADTNIGSIGVGTQPVAVAVNPVTNKIYVANGSSRNVTVIDGINGSTTTVGAGSGPNAVAVNPATNKIYVANVSSNNVTIIDGADNSTATVAVGSFPNSVAVNAVTNKIYVLNGSSDNVTVINGTDNSTTTIATGANPTALAVNPATNKIYVCNDGGTVTVIDGANGNTATVTVGGLPRSVAVNPVTNKAYVANQGNNTVTVIDGTNNSTSVVAVGAYPNAVGVNPVTNKIYVSNLSINETGTVTIIDGANNSTTTVTAGSQPSDVTINPVTNKIYITNNNSNFVTVIDGASNITITVATAAGPLAATVNPITNKAYVIHSAGNIVTVIDGSNNATSAIASDSNPVSVAVNPITNKVYVTKENASSVLVIDEANNLTATIPISLAGSVIDLNPITNKVYVVNRNANSVTVIDGETNSTKTIATGNNPIAIAINPVTNKIYIANNSSSSLTVIDGATDVTTNVPIGSIPSAIAVNPVTNKIYVASSFNGTVTVIEGATNFFDILVAGGRPSTVAINQVTNKIYVANNQSANVSVINGENEAIETVAVGSTPESLAVNPQTNKIYVANKGSNNVTVINGFNNATKTVASGQIPISVAVNPANNKIYVTNNGSNNLTVIDGTNDSAVNVATGIRPASVAVNYVTNKAYVANQGSASVTVLTPAPTNAIPLNTAVIPFFSNTTDTGSPTFTLTATSTYSPNALQPRNIYYQMDSANGAWTKANNVFTTATTLSSGAASIVTRGIHTLYFFATDGSETASINPRSSDQSDTVSQAVPGILAPQSSLVIGGINSYTFLANVPCSLTTSPAFQNFSASGGVGSTNISSNGCSWAVNSNVPWATVTGGNAGFGNGAFSYSVGTNIGPARAGTITVGDKTFTINQASGCTYSISTSSANLPANGGNGAINVTTVTGCTWTAVSNDPWISVTSGGLGSGNGEVTFTAASNTLNNRSGTITVAGNTFTVNQASGCAFSLSASSGSFGKVGGTGVFSINGSSVCNWTAVSSDSWITITSLASGSGSGNITYTVVGNNGPPRTGTISAGGKTYTISQSNGCSFVLAPTSSNVPSVATTSSFTVTTDAGCTWAAVSNSDWITLTDPISGSGSGSVLFAAKSNNGPARTGTISVADQTFTVNQLSGCAYSISPLGSNVPSGGGSGSFTLSTPAGCVWAAVSDVPWITVTGGSSGTGNANISFTVLATTGTTRTGTITIGGQIFSINQASGCTFSLSQSSIQIVKGGGTAGFAINGLPACAWTAVSNDSWITITGTSIGLGDGNISFTVAANEGPARVGTILAGGQTFTVNQSTGCTFAFTPNETTFSADGGVGGFLVTTNAVCSWVAASGSDWVRVDSGAGTGNGSVTFTVQVNPGLARRAEISIDSQIFTINQLGTTLATVSGRVLDPDGRGIKNATVRLTDQAGQERQAITNSFGAYAFARVPTGANYTIGSSFKRYRFVQRTITVNGDLSDIDFTGQE